jgi:hypothetical protein
MRRFIKVLTLLLVGIVTGVFGSVYYFHVPINLNPITIIKFGDGDVKVDNNVNQDTQPAPTPSAKPVESPAPKTADNNPPAEKTQQPREAGTGENGSAHSPQDIAVARPRSSSQPRTAHRVPSEWDRPTPTFVDYQQPPSVIRQECPPIIVRQQDLPNNDDVESFQQPSYPRRVVNSRSTSSSMVIVNGRVVSSSSITVVNGKVVSRSVYPSSPDNDDQ